jgi:hypothetical protein
MVDDELLSDDEPTETDVKTSISEAVDDDDDDDAEKDLELKRYR